MTKIDSEEKAIEFAKKDPDVKKHLENHKGRKIEYNAGYGKETRRWLVRICILDMEDADFEIVFTEDGKIINKKNAWA